MHQTSPSPATPFADWTVGVLVFPQVEELDFVGPWEMLTMWQQVAGGPRRCLVVAESTAPVVSAKGLSVNPHVAFDGCPPLDVLVVPGGQGTRVQVDNPALIGFVARQAAQARAVLSVCTGAFVLHRAGLLAGRTATTHWGSLDRLRALGGDVQVVEARYTRSGAVWCSAGVSAGLDMTLAFIADTAGAAVAGKVQFAAEYYPDGVRHGDFERHPRAPAYVAAAAAGR
jgi:transcriptional regulator GlxA family with amidase domain